MTENNPSQGIPEKPAAPPNLQTVEHLPTGPADRQASSLEDGLKSRTSRFRTKGFGLARESGKSPIVAPLTRSDKTGRTPRRLTWYWTVSAAALLLLGGTLFGSTLPDPKKSDVYVALQTEKDGLRADFAKLQNRYDTLYSGISGRQIALSTRENALKTAEAAVKTAEAAVKAAEANVKKREDAVVAAEKTKAANTIKEGTWTVGTDIEPGIYRTTSDVTGSCYWGIYRTGSNGADIVDNDIVSGGRPSVTLSAGQDFKTSRCGSWLKQ